MLKKSLSRSTILSDWTELGLEEVAGGVGVSPPLAPAPVITMLLGEWRALLEAGRRLEEVSTQNRGHGKCA